MKKIPPAVPQFTQPVVNPTTGVATQVWYQWFILLKAQLGGGIIAIDVTEITHADSPYTIQPSDCWLSCDASAGPITILPPALINGDVIGTAFLYFVKDQKGQSAKNPITLEMTIDGQKNPQLQAPYDARVFASPDGTTWNFLS